APHVAAGRADDRIQPGSYDAAVPDSRYRGLCGSCRLACHRAAGSGHALLAAGARGLDAGCGHSATAGDAFDSLCSMAMDDDASAGAWSWVSRLVGAAFAENAPSRSRL